LASGIRDADTQHATSVSLRVALAKMRDRPDTNQLGIELAQVREAVAAESNKLDEVNQQISGLEASRKEKIAKLGLNDLEDEIEETREQVQRVRLANTKDEAIVREQEHRVSEARDSLATLKKDANKLWLIPSTKGNSKEPLLVTVSGGGI
jgi:chromosome segregation ATPase